MLRLISFCCCVLTAFVAAADEPTASYLFPPGGQQGTRTTFRVGGHYLHNHGTLHLQGPGLQAVERLQRCDHTVWFEGPVIPLPDSQQKEDYPVDHLGHVSIAADAPPGVVWWRVSTSQGVTASLPFVVGTLPEVVEQEIDGDPIPVGVTLPVTINGRVFPREDIDIWEFDARKGQTVTCDVNAARIRSPLDSRLKIVGPDGNTVASNDDACGRDSRVTFTAERDGRFQVHLWDAELGGLQHYVYRLTITSDPYPIAVYPLGGRRGQTLAWEQIGSGHERSMRELVIPADASESIACPGVPEIRFETSDLEERLEAEPNDTVDSATASGVPAVLNGRVETPGDRDVWGLKAEKGVSLEIDLRAARLNSPLDSVLTIHDSNGNQLAESDDMASGQTDSQLTFVPPADGVYTLTVSDRFAGRGDARFGYRVYVRPSASLPPQILLTLPTDALNVKRGGEARLKIAATRKHGFTGAIQLVIDGLPSGVSVENTTIDSKKNDVTLTIRAAEDASVAVVPLTIRGRGETEGATIETVATLSDGGAGGQHAGGLWLGVTVPTPFRIVGDFETKYAARGSTFVRHYRIDRGGFEGPLTVRLAERQTRHLQGVTGPVIEVPAGVSEFDYPVALPPWMEIGRTSRTCLMAVGDLTLADGSQHTVSYTSFEQNDQIIVLVDPGQMNLRLEQATFLVRPGMTLEVPLEIRRGGDISGPVRIELIAAAHMQGIQCDVLEVPADEEHARLRIQLADSSIGPWNMPVIVRATVDVQGRACRAESLLTLVADPSAAAE